MFRAGPSMPSKLNESKFHVRAMSSGDKIRNKRKSYAKLGQRSAKVKAERGDVSSLEMKSQTLNEGSVFSFVSRLILRFEEENRGHGSIYRTMSRRSCKIVSCFTV